MYNIWCVRWAGEGGCSCKSAWNIFKSFNQLLNTRSWMTLSTWDNINCS